jgi:uncharacterized protein (TIGR00251 family)
MGKSPHFHDGKSGSALAIRVIPRAPRNQLVGILSDGTIKLRLSAAPVDGKANHGLIEYLAELLDIAPSKIELVAGQGGRNKLVSITGLTSSEVQARIVKHLP